jgi:hypothetical protein
MAQFGNMILMPFPATFGQSLVTKAVTFANTTGAVALFTVTGDVIVRLITVCTTDCASAGACNGEIGIAGATGVIVPTTDITTLAAREIWHDASPDAEIEATSDAMHDVVISDGNDIILTLSAQADSGALAVYCFWFPLSADGNVSAA